MGCLVNELEEWDRMDEEWEIFLALSFQRDVVMGDDKSRVCLTAW